MDDKRKRQIADGLADMAILGGIGFMVWGLWQYKPWVAILALGQTLIFLGVMYYTKAR